MIKDSMKNIKPVYETEFIIAKESKIHNRGVFAKKDIPKGTEFIEYLGERISKEEGTRRENASIEKAKKDHTAAGTYIFELDDTHDIDGDVPENPAKYINHSCEPNSETEIKDGKIWFFALKDIKKGEEISYNYGFEFNENFHLHPCKCGSKKCVGYILGEEEHHKLKAHLEVKKKR